MSRESQMIDAAGGGDLAGVEAALNGGANINFQGDMGMTALISAAMRGRASVVRLLLSRGASASVTDSLGMSALDYASNFPDVYSLLAGQR